MHRQVQISGGGDGGAGGAGGAGNGGTFNLYLTSAPNTELEAEMEAMALDDDFYHVEGDTIDGGFVVSKFPDRVDFYDKLNNRVVNIVPVTDLLDVANGATTPPRPSASILN